jgi:hypothetical protein
VSQHTAQIIPFVPLVRATPGYLEIILSNVRAAPSESEARKRLEEKRKMQREYEAASGSLK